MSDNQTTENPRLKRLETGALSREAETVCAMIAIYCRAHHRPDGKTLCPESRELAA